MSLKITDLSIGDWVSVDGKPHKVMKISGATELIQFYDSPNYCGIGGIEPIPITNKILYMDRFGFIKSLCDGINYVKFHRLLGLLIIKKRDRVFFEARIDYVHQLQHALRLAGLDEKINL